MKRISLTTTLLAAALVSPLALAAKGGKGKPAPVDQDFEIIYCWGSSFDPSCPLIETVLYANGDIEATWLSFPPYFDEAISNWGVWEVKGKKMTIEWDDNGAVYRGTREADGCYAGTMSADSGLTGTWEGCPL